MQTTVQYSRSDGIARVVLVPPEGKPPTMDFPVLDALAESLEQAAREKPCALLLGSASPRYFCVGANLNILKTMTPETIGAWVRRGHAVINQLEDLPFPVISRVDGYAMGGGLELAMGCDLILAGPSARFGQTEAGLGFIPGWGGTMRLAERVGHATAKRLFYSGTVIDGDEALRIGLVDFNGSERELDTELAQNLASIREKSAYALGTFKRILNSQRTVAREANVEAEALHSRGCLEDPGTIRRLTDFLEKRK